MFGIEVAFDGGGAWPPHYLGYFDCFNRGLFYEAHDVLEERWIAEGRHAANHAYYKGLIQLAGAFVHLQKNRLRPAVALYNLAATNLQRYPLRHGGLDLQVVLGLIEAWRSRIEAGGFEKNPLQEGPAPVLCYPGDP